jgi:hypothetical protein
MSMEYSIREKHDLHLLAHQYRPRESARQLMEIMMAAEENKLVSKKSEI